MIFGLVVVASTEDLWRKRRFAKQLQKNILSLEWRSLFVFLEMTQEEERLPNKILETPNLLIV